MKVYTLVLLALSFLITNIAVYYEAMGMTLLFAVTTAILAYIVHCEYKEK